MPWDRDGGEESPSVDLRLAPEHLWALGPLVGLYTVEDSCRILSACFDLGLDPVSMGAIAAWVAECMDKGISLGADFGDNVGFGQVSWLASLPGEIVNDPEKRELLGSGVKKAAENVGGEARSLAIHFDGQELTYIDPRRNFWPLSRLGPSINLTPLADSMNATEDSEHWADRLIRLEDQWALSQALGICPWAADAQHDLLELVPACLDLLGGPQVSPETLKDWGKTVIHLVKNFDWREGWRPQGQILAERFFQDQLAGSQATYPALNRENWLDGYRDYFSVRGWANDGEPEPRER